MSNRSLDIRFRNLVNGVYTGNIRLRIAFELNFILCLMGSIGPQLYVTDRPCQFYSIKFLWVHLKKIKLRNFSTSHHTFSWDKFLHSLHTPHFTTNNYLIQFINICLVRRPRLWPSSQKYKKNNSMFAFNRCVPTNYF